MKSFNFFLVFVALLLVSNVSICQSEKTNIKAVKKAVKLDTELKSENPAFALTESQKEQIVALQTERMEEISVYKKSNSNKEDVKAKSKELSKAMNNKIRKVILTEEQANAHRVYRKKMKGKKGKGAAKGKKASQKSSKGKRKKKAVTMTIEEADVIYASATAKQKAKAEKATEKLNDKISASDSNLALSDDQRKQITALNLKPIFLADIMKEEGLTKDEIKLRNKEIVNSNKRLIKSILSKEQKDAQKKKK